MHSNDESKMALLDYLINTANSVNKALDHGGLLDLQHRSMYSKELCTTSFSCTP